LKNSQCDILKTLNSKYGDIFVHNTGDLARTTNMKHKVHTDDALPLKLRAFWVSFLKHKKIRKQVNEMLKNDFREHSNSAWSSLVVLVKNKEIWNMERHMEILDFVSTTELLNSVTKKDNYPLPRIDDALD